MEALGTTLSIERILVGSRLQLSPWLLGCSFLSPSEESRSEPSRPRLQGGQPRKSLGRFGEPKGSEGQVSPAESVLRSLWRPFFIFISENKIKIRSLARVQRSDPFYFYLNKNKKSFRRRTGKKEFKRVNT